jgi:outer membrane protein assembly factor BamD
MRLRRILTVAAIVAGLGAGIEACKPAFNAATYPDMVSLFNAAMREYNAKHYDNSAKAFERLTTELPARDPKVPIAFFYLAKSQEKSADRLLAAKSYSRIYEQFPEDTLADDGLYLSGLAYEAMWRKPELDAEYGQSALTQFQTLQALYPNSTFVPKANQQISKLDAWFAKKDYLTGTHYLKRKAYDSAIIYFKDVIRLHPAAPITRDAYLRLHDAYTAINYKDDARDLCDNMRKAYPSDRDVLRECGVGAAPVATK